MLADLADFGHDYRSVNLQRPSAYLLYRNRNIFDSRVPALFLATYVVYSWDFMLVLDINYTLQ